MAKKDEGNGIEQTPNPNQMPTVEEAFISVRRTLIFAEGETDMAKAQLWLDIADRWQNCAALLLGKESHDMEMERGEE